MANELINPVLVAQDTLMRLENNTVFSKYVNREFDDKFAVPGDKAGYIFNARKPVRFRGRIGDGISPEDIRETVVPIAINRLWGVDMDISDQDLTLTVDRFGDRYIEPAAAKIANMIDAEGLDLYVDVFNHTGTPGTTPTSLATYAQANVILADSACPVAQNLRSIIVSPNQEASVLGFAGNIFNPAKTISDQYLTGKMGQAIGFKWSMDQNTPRHTVGAVGTSAPTMSAVANQSGNSILTTGWNASAAVLNRGDIMTIAGVNSVNPISYRDTGSLRTFTVLADTSSDGSGNATVPISPDINADPTSPFQTVTALPGASAVIKVFGVGTANFSTLTAISTPQAMACHRDAFTLAIVKMELPGGLEWSEQLANPKIGYNVRLTRAYSIQNNRKYTRIETLGGWKTLQPELAVRVSG